MKRKQSTTIPFGEWLPDLPDFGNPGLTVADGVIPDRFSYRPLPARLEAIGGFGNIGGVCRGFSGAVGAGHATYLYVGSPARLSSMVAETWVDVSKSGGYTLADDSEWEFVQFGDTFIATGYDDPIQSIIPGDPIFADMITSANQPKARHLGVVGQFLVLGHTNDATDGVKRSRVWWSAIRDQTDFDPDSATQCDYEDLKEGGDVQRVVGGVEYGLVFCERAIYRMTYAGPPLVFRFDPVDRKRGTPIPGSVVSLGRNVFYISDEGFYMTDGVSSTPIGQGKVDREFWDNFDISNRSRLSAAIDPVNKLIIWAFPDSGSFDGEVSKRFIYNWAENRWSSAGGDTIERIGNALSLGVTLDELADSYPNIETVPFSLDAISWTGGERVLAAFSITQNYSFFNGPNVEATLETGKIQLAQNRRSVTTKARPLVDGGTVTVQVAAIEQLSDTETFDSAASEDGIGENAIRADGRYHKIRTTIVDSGTWTHAQGVEVEHVVKGRR